MLHQGACQLQQGQCAHIWRHASTQIRTARPGTHKVILHQHSLQAGLLLRHFSAFPVAVELFTQFRAPPAA